MPHKDYYRDMTDDALADVDQMRRKCERLTSDVCQLVEGMAALTIERDLTLLALKQQQHDHAAEQEDLRGRLTARTAQLKTAIEIISILRPALRGLFAEQEHLKGYALHGPRSKEFWQAVLNARAALTLEPPAA